jgi:hypothetical protein
MGQGDRGATVTIQKCLQCQETRVGRLIKDAAANVENCVQQVLKKRENIFT